MDVGRRLGQPPGQDPLPGTDLEDDVGRVELGVAEDRVEQVRVGEEVLPEPHHPNRVRPFSSTTRSNSS